MLPKAASRFAISLILLVLYGLFAAIRCSNQQLDTNLLDHLIRNEGRIAFWDMRPILQANACFHNGVDVYQPSACMAGGIYNYSLFLLDLNWLPGPSHALLSANCLNIAFIAGLALLPPARSEEEFLFRLAAIGSSTSLYILEACNIDAALWLLVAAGVLCLAWRRRTGYFGYAVFLIGAAVKFYPIVLLGLIIRERLLPLLVSILLATAATGMFWLHYHHAISTALAVLPRNNPFYDMFGASNLAFGIELVLALPKFSLFPSPADYAAASSAPIAPLLIFWLPKLLTLAALLRAAVLAARYQDILPEMPEVTRLLLAAGAMVMCFCFYLTQNYEYREVYLYLTLPGLWWARRVAPWARHTVIFLLWESLFMEQSMHFGMATEILAWLMREALWWWLMIHLSAIVLAFIRNELDRLKGELTAQLASKPAK